MLIRNGVLVQSIHGLERRVHSQFKSMQSVGGSDGRGDDAGETTGSLQLDQRVDGGLGGLCGNSLLEFPELEARLRCGVSERAQVWMLSRAA